MASIFWFSLLVLFGTTFLLWAGNFTGHRATQKDGSVNRLKMQWEYQLLTLLFAVFLAMISITVSGINVRFLGNLEASATSMSFWGFSEKDTWASVGLVMAFVPAIGTTIVVCFQMLKGKVFSLKLLPKSLLLCLPLAILNSLTEEIIFRFIAVNTLSSVVSSATVAIASGVAFGLPHYFGSPGKIIGVFMAGALGWVMANAMVETGGFAISWFIHFIQDIPIMAMMLLTSFSSNLNSQKSSEQT
ncbi:MAG: hypothetical protein RL228_1312 [Actinomycetota bacterium]